MTLLVYFGGSYSTVVNGRVNELVESLGSKV